MDGVMTDDFAYDMQRVFIHFNYRPGFDFSLENQTAWSLSDHWSIPDDVFDEYIVKGVDAGMVFRDGEAAPGSVDCLARLRAKGHTIHIITARRFGQKFAHNTLDWLFSNGVEFDAISFIHDKFDMPVDLLLDDHERNYNACTERGMHVVLMDKVWNRHLTDAHRVNWETFEDYVDVMFPPVRSALKPCC